MSAATAKRKPTYDEVIAKEVAKFDRYVLETAKAMNLPQTTTKRPSVPKAAKSVRKCSTR